MHHVFKFSKADILSHPDLCRDLSAIAEDVVELKDSFLFYVIYYEVFDFLQRLRALSISCEADLRSGTTTFF